MRYLLSSIAIAALAAATVHADPGGGKGHAGGNSAQSEAPRGGGNGADKGERGNGKSGGNGNGDARGQVFESKPDRGMSERGEHGRADKQHQLPAQARDERNMEGNGKGAGRDEKRGEYAGRENAGNDKHARVNWRDYDNHGLVNGCPPGLAKKHNGCMPPGQAKHEDQRRYDANWFGLRGLSDGSGYRYIDGNLVRLSPNGAIAGYYPLLGGALAVGNPWPSGWQPTPLSPYYSDYYGLGNDYRYFDGAIYRVDPQTSAIQSIAALLTGDTFNVGQRLPQGYSAYNVPAGYRDQYIDGPDAQYRYNDGYVYKVDTRTQLIAAAIELLS